MRVGVSVWVEISINLELRLVEVNVSVEVGVQQRETLWLNFMFCTKPGWTLDPFVPVILKQFLFFNLEVYKPCPLFF